MSDEKDSSGAGGALPEAALDAVGGVSDAVASALPEGEAKRALEAASMVTQVASGAAKVIGGLADVAQSRDVGSAASALGSAAGGAGGVTSALGSGAPGASATKSLGSMTGGAGPLGSGLRGAQGIGSSVGGLGHGASALGRGISDLASALGGDTHEVSYHFEVDGAEGQWTVRSVDFHEALNEPYELTVHGLVADAHPEAADLLGKDCSLTLERPSQTRSIKGIIRKARVNEAHAGDAHARLVVVPAAWLLGQNKDSRIYQRKTVPEIVEELYKRHLGGRGRQVQNDLTRTYPQHEYVTQYQESDLAFLTRLCEQEGIFFYFDHDDDREKLILADATSGLAAVRDDGRTPYWGDAGQAPDGEAVLAAHHTERVGTTDVVLGDYDWTHPGVAVRGEQTGRGDGEPALEEYDHTDAVAIYDYDSGSRAYGANDATRQAEMRAARLDLDRQQWSMRSTVVTAQPGRIIELTGCPDGSLDGRRYLITAIHASGTTTEGTSGSYENGFDCVPIDLPFRPARKVPRPVVLGPETATVVGPSGEEIHTDEHGRIKVQFHWDRQGQRDEHSSCWLRVAQMWGGPSWGTWFLPRIGMEVIVHFVGGIPDRPFVAGSLYNGDNPPPYPLPDEKTKSTIKTNSTVGGGGSNELRFEDKKGSEEVYIHAEKDFNEVVENNHTTRVKNCQTNTVDVDQTETIGRDQTMTVKRDRKKSVDGNETSFIGGGEGGPGHRLETVWGNEDVTINQNRTHTVVKDETLLVKEGKRTVTVETGKNDETYLGGRNTEVDKFDNLKVIGGANHNVVVSGQYNIKVDGAHYSLKQGDTEKIVQANRKTYVESASEVHVVTGASDLLMKKGGEITVTAKSKIAFECGAAKLELNSDGSILIEGTSVQVKGGEGVLKLEPAGATVKGPKVDVLADMFCTIKGTLVRIN